jgi:hypothetical protein
MPDMTVVYYTSNTDWPTLEQEVRNIIARNSDGLPIVCVSHRPVEGFGHNIVVGERERGWDSIFMQMRLGVEHASTKYVAICESDFLLPQTFFEFRPPDEETYCWPTHGYITFQWRPSIFYRKKMKQTVGIVGREHLLSIVGAIADTHGTKPLTKLISRLSKTECFDMGSVVTLKTRQQMHLSSPYSRNEIHETLPEWGPASEVWKQMRHET